MPAFQVRYWFDSNARDKTGENVIENVEAESAEAAARDVQERMREPTFFVSPAFGPAQNVGLVVVNAALVRYVEVVPLGTGGVPVE
jgi:hypothetical protein